MTLLLMPHFIAFFSDEEIPGTPGTLATTFLAFGMFPISDLMMFSRFSRSHLSIDLTNVSSSYRSFKPGICFKRYGFLNYAHFARGCQYHNYRGMLSPFFYSLDCFSLVHHMVKLSLVYRFCEQAYEKKTSPKWPYDLGRKKNFEQVSVDFDLTMSFSAC